MKLSVSNIAWDVEEDSAMVDLLHRYGVDTIDVAPGKYFPDPVAATEQQISDVKHWWAQRGIEITGMQALLFGTSGLNVFGSAESQENLLKHMAGVCRIGAGLGATKLVFGSPKNRDRSGLSDAEAMVIAVAFFKKLGDIAKEQGVVVCLEPNPAHYGANFMTTSEETASVVSQIAHPAIKMQLDTGALAINGEDCSGVLEHHVALIGHIHLSEPDLVPLGDGAVDHGKIAQSIKEYLSEHVATIETVATKNEPHLVAVERSLTVAVNFYRNQTSRE